MTREEYRAHPALNYSLAKHLLTSPAHFKAAQDEEQEETDAMRIGTLAHAFVLEGKDLRSMYAIKPEGMTFVSKEGKAWRDAQTLPILTEKDANGLPRIADSIAANPHAAAALRGCSEREVPIIATMHGVECKALLDLRGTDGETWAIGDLKTALDASPDKFGRQAYQNHLDMQAAWYSDLNALVVGADTPPWWFWIVTEKKAPFYNVVYQPDERMMESGRNKVAKALGIYKRCVASGEWPMPTEGVRTLTLPSWVRIDDTETYDLEIQEEEATATATP